MALNELNDDSFLQMSNFLLIKAEVSKEVFHFAKFPHYAERKTRQMSPDEFGSVTCGQVCDSGWVAQTGYFVIFELFPAFQGSFVYFPL